MLRSLLYRSGKGLALAALTLLLAAGTVLAQTGRVEGTVRNAQTGDAVAGARVTVIGTALAATTNENGYYAIEDVPVGTYNLRVSVIGYQSVTITNQLVTAGLPTTANFSLTPSVLRIEGVVVTGVAERTQVVKLPFTVDQVAAEDVPVPAMTAEESIRGKVAGARVIRGEGTPGESSVTVLLRGATSIDASGRSNEPLYVVDGTILGANSMIDIDALDIESIEVVKGAAASALYGARAANGVVSVTTRRGRDIPEGETKIIIRSEFGRNDLFHETPQAQAHRYQVDAAGNWLGTAADGTTDSTVSPNDRALAAREHDWRPKVDIVTGDCPTTVDPGCSAGTYAVADNPYGGRTFDQIGTLFDPGSFYTNSLSISHRTGQTNFLASFHETRERGVVDQARGYLRRGARINVDHNLGGNFDFSASAYYAQSEREEPGSDIFWGLTFYPIDIDLKEREPEAQARIDAGIGTARDSVDFLIQPDPLIVEENPIYEALNTDDTYRRSRVLGNFRVRWRPIEGFDLESDFSFDRSDENRTQFFFKGFKTLGASSVNVGRLRKNNDIDQAINASLTAAYSGSFGDFNTVTKARILLERAQGNFFQAQATDLAVDNVRDLDLGDQARNQITSSSDEIRSLGYFLSTQFDYKDRYIVDALVRRDGSSLFGEEERWHVYYRVSGAYRLTQEDWWPWPFFDEFKLRYSRGTAGGRPRFTAQYETFAVSAGSVSKGNLGNKDLKPEFATEQEFGVDVMFGGRFSLIGTYARSVVEEQLLLVPLAGFFGFSDQWRNAGTLTSNTLEGTLQAAIIQKPDVTWNFNFVIDRTRQQITEFDLPPFRTGPGSAFYVREGEKLGTMWGDRWATTCSEIFSPTAGFGSGTSCLVESGGNFQVNDDGYLVPVGADNVYTDGIDKNYYGGTITLDGVSYRWGLPFLAQGVVTNPATGVTDTTTFLDLGITQPDFNFGFGNTFRYKGLTVYALFDAQIGGVIYNNTRQWSNREGDGWETDQSAKPANQRKTLLYYQILYDVNAVNSHYVEDATYLKFRELAVRYTFDRSQLEGVFGGVIKRVSVSLIGRNLHTFTGYLGYDPEVSTSNSAGAIFRYDGFEYPNFRTITGAVELEF